MIKQIKAQVTTKVCYSYTKILLHGGSDRIKQRKESRILQWTETENRIAIFKAGNGLSLLANTRKSPRVFNIRQSAMMEFQWLQPWVFHSWFFKALYCLEKLIITMANGTSEPLMCWETSNLVEFFKFFQQQCNLYFSMKGIPEKKQGDNILLLSGIEGLRRYNS